MASSFEVLPGEVSDPLRRFGIPPIPRLSTKSFLASYDERSAIGSAPPCSSAPS